MTTSSSTPGKTTIAPEVLTSIAKLTALSVEGVSKLASIPSDVNRFFNRNVSEGIKINVDDGTVYADIFVVIKSDMNVREVCHNIQHKVSRAISEMVGMEVGKINIHVEDIDLTTAGD